RGRRLADPSVARHAAATRTWLRCARRAWLRRPRCRRTGARAGAADAGAATPGRQAPAGPAAPRRPPPTSRAPAATRAGAAVRGCRATPGWAGRSCRPPAHRRGIEPAIARGVRGQQARGDPARLQAVARVLGLPPEGPLPAFALRASREVQRKPALVGAERQ